MRFHLPKPLHGWREFAGEVGVIVIGVLIALGGEQLVTAVHSRSEANDARQAIRGELEFNMARLTSRSAQKNCAERRIADLQSLLDRTAAGAWSWVIHTFNRQLRYRASSRVLVKSNSICGVSAWRCSSERNRAQSLCSLTIAALMLWKWVYICA